MTPLSMNNNIIRFYANNISKQYISNSGVRHLRPTRSSHKPSIQRYCKFSSVASTLRDPTADDLAYFRSILSYNHVLTTLEDDNHEAITPYNTDWTNRYIGQSALVLKPTCTSQVSEILSYCHSNHLGVVPRGGNTGLCGGATPISTEIVLSLENMTKIHSLDPASGIVVADAGCILQNLQEFTEERGYLLPLDIGSKGSCQIGGNVATNAGGGYFYRFGGLHGTVVGMEVVLPQGKVLRFNLQGSDDGSRYIGCHRKDNTGYDIKHLFIGAEGTLGVVTRVAIACPPLPTSKNVALLVCNSYSSVLKVLVAAKEVLGEVLSAMELMDWNTLSLVRQNMNDKEETVLLDDMLTRDNETESNPFYLLVETQGSNTEHDTSKMDSFLTRLFEASTISNGYLGTDSKKIHSFWSIREACNPSVARSGYVYKYDVSVPIEEYMEVASDVRAALSGSASIPTKVCVWGHLFDGNAHVNVITQGLFQKDEALSALVDEAVYGSVLKRKGSVSAEHGIGQSKNEVLRKVKDENVMQTMVQLKGMFDPHGIMNPGKVLSAIHPSSMGG